MRPRSPAAGWVVLSFALASSPVLAGEAAAPQASEKKPALEVPESTLQKWLDEMKRPVSWLEWGGDIRIRQEYLHNAFDFSEDTVDRRNVIRIRPRLWVKAGPFFRDPDIKQPNGLTLYARMTYEPRYYVNYQESAFNKAVENPDWNEVVYDNLYADWQRIGGLPLSLRVGRQDMSYGNGFVIGDGTPGDGSRTTYSDAIKATIHLDEWKSALDLFVMDNKASESRLEPFSFQHKQVAQHDAELFGAYFTSKYFKDQELGAYYIYKDEDLAEGLTVSKLRRSRVVDTIGATAQGKFGAGWGYYGELAGQWGTEAGTTRRGLGLSSDLGYTFKNASWTPRLHAGYEYLSGDDPGTRRYEGWDPVLSRTPQWSELMYYRWGTEDTLQGYWTNLQRLTLGGSVKPTKKATLSLDYSYLLANEHQFGKAGIYDEGFGRGHLFAAKLIYEFNKRLSGHLWINYLIPGSYYADDSDNAAFLRWQLVYTF